MPGFAGPRQAGEEQGASRQAVRQRVRDVPPLQLRRHRVFCELRLSVMPAQWLDLLDAVDLAAVRVFQVPEGLQEMLVFLR